MRMLYCHGKDGSPAGAKPAALRAAGHTVVAPELPRDDFEASLALARRAVEETAPEVLIGSSRGGAVAMRVAAEAVGAPPLVLLAPAWRRCGVAPEVRHDTRIVHGIKDEVIPLADSIELETVNGLAAGNLIPVNDGHRLATSLALATLLRVVGELEGAGARRNQIFAIRPYVWEGLWVFDDARVGLVKEALIAGMPEMIELATAQAGIRDPHKGFVALFSADPFPGARVCLEWARSEVGGDVYRWPETGMEGWLCPALLRYFDRAPRRLYIDVRAA